jgi:hypothetical protein
MKIKTFKKREVLLNRDKRRKSIDYARIVSKEFDIPQRNIMKIFKIGWNNIQKFVYAGNDVKINKFGTIFFNKINIIKRWKHQS